MNRPHAAPSPGAAGALRRLAAHTGLFCGLLAALYLALVLCALIPNEALRSHYEDSARFYETSDPFQFHSGGKWNAIADNYADAILLNVAWRMGNGSPWTAVLDTDYYDGGPQGESVGLTRTVAENVPANTDYTRYWHGGAIPVRCLHLFTDVNGIKWIGFAAIVLLLGLTALTLLRRGHGDLALLLSLALAAVQLWNTRLSLEYQTPFLVALGLCPLYLRLERRGDGPLTLLSVAGGVLVAFFDFLTAETLTLLLPLLLVVAARAKEGRLAPFWSSLALLVRCGLCWGLAYGGAFLVKWGLASLVSGENAFTAALAAATERVSGATELGQDDPTGLLSPIAANLSTLFGGVVRVQTGRILVGLAAFLGALGSVWYLFHAPAAETTASSLMLLLGGVVFLRYLALYNHSYLHEFFTYRALAAPILAALLALRLNLQPPRRRSGRKRP